MNAFRLCIFLAMSPALCGPTASAQVLEPEALQRKQDEQQRARSMTRELVTGVLDLQLRQLEENDLTDLEVYREIQLMRDNLGDVIDAEMTRVVELLAAAQAQPKAEREAAFVAARQMVRTIVLTLSAERQNLLRRLKIAELAEQVRRLITLQSQVQSLTKQLTKEAKTRQEALTLKTVEDQRDVKEMFLLLVETLSDVRTWGGGLSQAAADGLKLLKAASVGKDLDQAGQALRSTQYAAALAHQDAAIRSLRELLKLLQRAQGVMGSENQSVIQRLQEIARQQEALREEIRKQDPSAKISELLVEQQAKIQMELSRLEDMVAPKPQAEAHLDQAKNAAETAAARLFENQAEQAVAEQTKVLGQLSALEAALKEASGDVTANQSAAELAKLVQDLEQAKMELAFAQQQQDNATKAARTNAQAAAVPESQVAAALERVITNQDLPTSLESRLADAKTAVDAAVKGLSEAAAEPANEPQQESLEHAEDVLDRAVAAVESALQDAQRRQSAVEIGELARAAEVLERAAAEEREIAASAELAASAAAKGDHESTAEIAREAAARQATVTAVAEKVSLGLEQTSPESAKSVAAGKTAAKQAEQELIKAADSAEKSALQAKSPVAAAAELAKAAAEKFAVAAQQLRKEIAESAGELADVSDAQSDKLQAALREVEKALQQKGTSLMGRMEQLTQAQARVSESAKQQQLASGRPEAVQAMDLAEKIAAAAKSQDFAHELAVAAQNDDDISPLRAAIEQQEAVERTQEAAKAANERPQAAQPRQPGQADPLTQALTDAQTKAQEAAKSLVDGDEQAAQANQDAAEVALKAALALAQAEVRDTLEKPAVKQPSPMAQDLATQLAQEAQRFASQDAPAAAETLAAAVDAGKQARQELTSRQPEKALPAQQKSMQALTEAAKSIDAAMDRLAAEQAQQLAEQAKLAEQLGDDTTGLDLGAAEALDAAKHAAELGTRPESSRRERVMSARRAQQNLERAAANLATKEQAVRRDQAVANALSELASEQIEAADVLSGQRDEMTEPSAAEAVVEAAEVFAEAQQALGQGAVELSGQVEVANRPLREALELASEFLSAKNVGEDLHRMPMDEAHGQVPDEKVTKSDPDRTSVERPDTDAPAPDDTPQDMPADDAASLAVQPPQDLGTDFVPKSPDLTARMMAGPKGRAALKAAEAQEDDTARTQRRRAAANPKKSALRSKLTRADRSDLNAAGDEAVQAAESADTAEFSSNKQSTQTDNAGIKEDPIQKMEEGTKVADKRGSRSAGDDESQTLRKFREAPWFAKLPPELRRSIRANSQQRAPRAYEERLRKYFESVD